MDRWVNVSAESPARFRPSYPLNLRSRLFGPIQSAQLRPQLSLTLQEKQVFLLRGQAIVHEDDLWKEPQPGQVTQAVLAAISLRVTRERSERRLLGVGPWCTSSNADAAPIWDFCDTGGPPTRQPGGRLPLHSASSPAGKSGGWQHCERRLF